MIKDVVSVKPHTTIERAAKILLRMRVSAPACHQRYRQTHRKATVFDAERLAPVASSLPGIVNLIDRRVEDGESPRVKSTGAYRGVSRQVANAAIGPPLPACALAARASTLSIALASPAICSRTRCVPCGSPFAVNRFKRVLIMLLLSPISRDGSISCCAFRSSRICSRSRC